MSGITVSCPFEVTHHELEVIRQILPVIVLQQHPWIPCGTVHEAVSYIEQAEGLVFLREQMPGLQFLNLPVRKPYHLFIEKDNEVLLLLRINQRRPVEIWPDLRRPIQPLDLGIEL